MPERKLIAEVGACCNDLDWALRAVNALRVTDTWAFKVQMYRRDRLVSHSAPTYGDPSLGEPATQYENLGVTIPYNAWRTVKEACDDAGLEFFASVFDPDAALHCAAWDVNHFKIASADITYRDLLRVVGGIGKHVFLSTGGATEREIEQAIGWIGHDDITLFACTLQYPAAEAHLGRMRTLQNLFGLPVGYSDHTVSYKTPAKAWDLGATHVEKHVTIESGIGGDHNFALHAPTWVQRAIECKATATPEDIGDGALGVHSDPRAVHMARRSAHATRSLPEGHRLTADDIAYLRPSDGISPAVDIIGERLARPVREGEPILE